MLVARTGLAFVVVGAVLLSACAGDGEDTDASAVATASSTASVEATPTATSTLEASPTSESTSTAGPRGDVTVYEETDEHRVRLEYPASWTRNPDYFVQFDGPDGFVQVGDLGNDGQGLDAAVEAIAHHKLMPYGSDPTLEPVTVDGVEGVLIRPSADQLPANVPLDKRHVAVVIPRGEPLHIGGSDYEYLVLYVDEAHAESILASVVLLPPR